MNDKQIECFIQAAMLRNFRAAGEALYISQPAVSHHIRMLEEELGFPLFRREHQHIELTVAGHSFFRDCVYIKALADDAVKRAERLSQAQPGRELTLAYTYVLGQSQLAVLLQTYGTGNYPFTLKLRQLDDEPEGNILWLRYGLADMVFCLRDEIQETEDLAFCPLWTAISYCIVSSHHHLAGKSYLSYQDLRGEAVLRLPAGMTPGVHEDVFLRLARETPSVEFRTVESPSVLRIMVNAGQGIQFLPLSRRQAAIHEKEGIKAIPFRAPDALKIGVGWRKDRESPALLQLLSLVRIVFEEPE